MIEDTIAFYNGIKTGNAIIRAKQRCPAEQSNRIILGTRAPDTPDVYFYTIEMYSRMIRKIVPRLYGRFLDPTNAVGYFPSILKHLRTTCSRSNGNEYRAPLHRLLFYPRAPVVSFEFNAFGPIREIHSISLRNAARFSRAALLFVIAEGGK